MHSRSGTTQFSRRSRSVPVEARLKNRRGTVGKVLLGVLIVLGLAGGVLAWNGKIFAHKEETTNLVFEQVKRGPLEIIITERGNLESAQNSTLVCMVEGEAGVGILEIKEEGKLVKKDEIVIKLDASKLNNDKQSQEITVEQAAATLKTAETNLEIQEKQNESDIAAAIQKLDLAKLDLEKYEDGDYEQELKTIKGEIQLATEELTRANDKYAFTQRLVKKGYAKQSEVEADRVAVKKSEISVAVAEEKLRVLEDYTKKRQMTELESNAKEFERELARVKLKSEASLAKYRADLSAAKLTAKVEQDKALKILAQIDACTIKAPRDGLVVYVNTRAGGFRGGSEPLIYEGAKVKERQPIINLPDVTNMQVNARIHESKISMVKEKLQATIHLDAKAGTTFHGEVAYVSLVSSSGNWPNINLKEYVTYIKLTDDVEKVSQLKPGLTAEVDILVDRLVDVLQAPVQSFVERGGNYYVWLKEKSGKVARRTVKIGKSNELMMEIVDGLAEKDELVQTPRTALPKEIALLESEVPAAVESPTSALKAPDPTKAAPPAGGRGGRSGPGSPGEAGAGAGGPVAGGGGPGGGGGGGGGRRGGGDPSQFFASLDKDGDGKLTEEEMPERMKANFAAMDANKDKSVDKDEFLKAMEAFRNAGGGRGEGRGGARPEAGGGQ